MKKLLPFLSLAILIVACNSKPEETQTLQSAQAATIDTAGLAQFQQWKAQNELAVNEVQPEQQPAAEPVKTVTIIREVRVPQTTTTHKKVRQSSAPVRTAPVESTTENTSSGSSNNTDVASTSESSNTAEAPATQPAETAQKKGWSKATKGAVIGGAGGAVLGAIINKKNRAAGAVIGGVLGAGVGYGIGKKTDHSELQMH